LSDRQPYLRSVLVAASKVIRSGLRHRISSIEVSTSLRIRRIADDDAQHAGQLFKKHCGIWKLGAKKAVFLVWFIIRGLLSRGRDMAFIVVGVAIGAFCALLPHRVFMMVALSALLAPVVALVEFGLHAHPWVIAAQTLGSIMALQFVYVAVGLTLHLVRFGKLIPHVQTAIGDRLRAELEAPRGLTPELSVLVARLRST
jgi:hypothetical protein